jgi:uncharacterized protein YigE (DUF2233 family)
MRPAKVIVLFISFISILLLAALALTTMQRHPATAGFISYRVDLRREQLRLYWQDRQNQRFGSLGRLHETLAAQGQPLVFAMNGGMFNDQYAPQGLFIENGRLLTPLDTSTKAGNFYLKPNGVFYLTTANEARICKTEDFRAGQVRYATQSGPMLVIEGRIHPAFRPGSANLQIRNGVGILPDRQVLLAMSKTPVSFYAFAEYFRRAGCRNALYLDGYVSRTYAPAAGWTQTDGNFGVIIGVTRTRQP